jgi:hypothetical protein
MPPDFVLGEDISHWPEADRAQEYNRHLVSSNSVRVGGRHYALRSWYKAITKDCLVIDGSVNPNIDIIVDIAPIGKCTCRKSLVSIRYILSPTQDSLCEGKSKRPLLVEDLRIITLHNTLVRKRVRKGTARANGGDFGDMHAMGTHAPRDGEGLQVVEYAANSKIPRKFFRKFVKSLAKIGAILFPDVLAVIQDAEGDTGLSPVSSMGKPGNMLRVGFTIDMSVDLGNSSHYDVGDVSQGFSVWTEEVPGLASNWYFVMPNLYGIGNDGNPFNSVAVKLHHGTAISWDGRVIRHCTSLTSPDGRPETQFVSESSNHVYGTFSAAKERIVNVGRCIAAATKRKRTDLCERKNA